MRTFANAMSAPTVVDRLAVLRDVRSANRSADLESLALRSSQLAVTSAAMNAVGLVLGGVDAARRAALPTLSGATNAAIPVPTRAAAADVGTVDRSLGRSPC